MNAIEQTMKILEAARSERIRYHLTLGRIINKLKKYNPDYKVTINDHRPAIIYKPEINSEVRLSTPSNYRTYHEDLAFKLDYLPQSVKELLEICEECLNKEFNGFNMGEDTPLWVGDEQALIDISSEDDGRVILIIKDVWIYYEDENIFYKE